VRTPAHLASITAAVLLMLPALALADGFDRAISSASARVVKLYGLGAGAQAGYGTGVLVSTDGRVLTIFSLLIDARRIRAVTADGTRYEATVVRRDAERQLALLQLVPWGSSDSSMRDGDGERVDSLADSATPKVGPLPAFDLATGRALNPTGEPEIPSADASATALLPGDWVIAAGNAFKVAEGSEPVSIARGVFSVRTRLDARRRVRDYPYRGDVLVIDAITSNPGAPGSAVVNLEGRLVGMIGRDVVSNLTHTHFNYAVPMDVVTAFLNEVDKPAATADPSAQTASTDRSPSTTDTPRDLGFRVTKSGYRTVLPFVERVKNGSPAGLAGVQIDDLILSVNGKTVGDVDEYNDRLKTLRSDEPVDLVLRRGRAILTVRIEAGNN